VVPAGPLVRIRLEGDISIAALITRRSAETLALTPGASAVARIKATALRAFVAS
jgi:molybdopterin-binding protein